MASIKKIHQLFKLRFNKLDSAQGIDLVPAFIDLIVNEAINRYQEIFYSGSGKIGGFEINQQRLDMLKDYVANLTISAGTSALEYNIKKVNFVLPNRYKHVLKSFLNCTSCTPNRILLLRPEQHDDLDKSNHNNYFRQPSVVWGECPYRIYGNTLEASIPKNIVVNELRLTYLTKPILAFFGGYNTIEYLNGDTTAPSSTSPIVDLELNDAYIDVLVDIMVDITSEIYSDVNKSQLFKNKINTIV